MRAADQRQAVVRVTTADRGVVTDIWQRGFRASRGEVCRIRLGRCVECLLAPRRDRQNQHLVIGDGRDHVNPCRRTLDDDVRIRAAEAERIDAGNARGRAIQRPRLERLRHPEPQVVERDVRVGHREMQVRRDHAVLDAQRRFDETGDARGRLGMADIALDRSDDALFTSRATGAEYAADGFQLDRIAGGRARAVRFDVVHMCRIDARPPIHLGEHRGLGDAVRERHARRPAVLIDERAADDGVDAVAVLHGLRKRLQEHHTCAFGADVPVGALVEALALPVGGQHRGLAEADVAFRSDQRVDSADHCEIAVAVPDGLTGEVHRDKRRGARRIHRHARSVKVELMRDPVGGDTDAEPDIRIRVNRVALGGARLDAAVVARRDADENTRARSGKTLRRLPRVFHRLVRRFEQPPVLRVDARRLSGRNAEEVRVELVEVVDVAAPSRRNLARPRRVRVAERAHVPPLRGNLGDRIDTVAQESPQAVGVHHVTRQPARHADDGDRLSCCRVGRLG